MKLLRALGAFSILVCASASALAQTIPDLKGTWTPTEGVHIVDGASRHARSGTTPVPGAEDLQTHKSKFVFRFDGQEGRTFWGELSSAEVTEELIGAISVDGKRFVMADKDGTFAGAVVDADTLDYCYTHVTPTDQAVACGLLKRDK